MIYGGFDARSYNVALRSQGTYLLLQKVKKRRYKKFKRTSRAVCPDNKMPCTKTSTPRARLARRSRTKKQEGERDLVRTWSRRIAERRWLTKLKRHYRPGSSPGSSPSSEPTEPAAGGIASCLAARRRSRFRPPAHTVPGKSGCTPGSVRVARGHGANQHLVASL